MGRAWAERRWGHMKTGLARMAWLAPAVALASACLASSAGAQVVTDPVTGHKFGIVPQLASTSAANRASGRRRGLSLAAPFSAACNADGNDCTPLRHNGGPVQHAENDYLFFWAPTSYTPAFPPTYRAGLENWLNQVAAASNTNGNPFSVNQQYY